MFHCRESYFKIQCTNVCTVLCCLNSPLYFDSFINMYNVPAENYKVIGMKLGQFFLPLVPPNT